VKMRGKKIVLAVAAIVALVAGSTFAGSSAQAAGKQKTIGVAVADQKSLFYIAAVDGMKKAAKANNVKLIILSADNDANKQVGQVNSLLTQNIDALVFIAQDATAATAGVKAANKAKVPVIAVDEKPEAGNGVLATYIATNSVTAADQLCTWLFKQVGNKGEIGILHGVLGATAEVQRTQGCQAALKRTPGIKVAAEATANWDETQAYKAAQNMLQANPNIVAIFGESDAMGKAAGMDSALVLTGETTLQMLDDADPCAQPTYTFESVQGLVKSPPS
jgi:ribose transport system substrate-binding protein